MSRSGLTLVELLVSLAISSALVGSIAVAHTAAVRHQQETARRRQQGGGLEQFEAQVYELLGRAYLSADEADATSYFLTSASGGELATIDTLTFTALPPPLPPSFLTAGGDLVERNARYGPQGGLVEHSLGPVVVGDGVQGGLLLRTQHPSDGDTTQGGRQRTLAAEAELVGFEFWDGTAWQPEWDTQSGARRLPAAVRLQYRWGGEAETRTMVVRLRNSDVTAENPVLVEGGG